MARRRARDRRGGRDRAAWPRRAPGASGDAAEEVPGGRALARGEGGERRQAAGDEGPALVLVEVALRRRRSAETPAARSSSRCGVRLVTRALKRRVPPASPSPGRRSPWRPRAAARRRRRGRAPRRGLPPGPAGRACARTCWRPKASVSRAGAGVARGAQPAQLGREVGDLLERQLGTDDDGRGRPAGQTGGDARGAGVEALQRVLERVRASRATAPRPPAGTRGCGRRRGPSRARGRRSSQAASASKTTSGSRQRSAALVSRATQQAAEISGSGSVVVSSRHSAAPRRGERRPRAGESAGRRPPPAAATRGQSLATAMVVVWYLGRPRSQLIGRAAAGGDPALVERRDGPPPQLLELRHRQEEAGGQVVLELPQHVRRAAERRAGLPQAGRVQARPCGRRRAAPGTTR